MENRPPQASDAPSDSDTRGVLQELTSALANASPIKHLPLASVNKFRQVAMMGEDKALEGIASVNKEYCRKQFASFEALFCAKFEAKFDELKADVKVVNTKVAHLEAENEILKKDNEILKKDNESLKKDNESLKKDNESLNTKVAHLQAENVILTTRLAAIDKKVKAVEQRLKIDASGYTKEKTDSTIAAAQSNCGKNNALVCVEVPQGAVDACLHEGILIPNIGLYGSLNITNYGGDKALVFIDLPRKILKIVRPGKVWIPLEVFMQLSPDGLGDIRIANSAIKLVLMYNDRGASQQELLQLSQVSIAESPLSSHLGHDVVVCNVECSLNLLRLINRHFLSCAKKGTFLLFHFTSEDFAVKILMAGLRIAKQGQANGGVYFSTLGPGYYGVGTGAYEKNIISGCFGAEHAEEYGGKNKFDVVIVYSSELCVLDEVPNREGAVMIPKSLVQHLIPSNEEGDYYLSCDNILGAYKVDDITGSDEHINALRQLEEESSKKVLDAIGNHAASTSTI